MFDPYGSGATDSVFKALTGRTPEIAGLLLPVVPLAAMHALSRGL